MQTFAMKRRVMRLLEKGSAPLDPRAPQRRFVASGKVERVPTKPAFHAIRIDYDKLDRMQRSSVLGTTVTRPSWRSVGSQRFTA
jgi:predicted transcriptional regulator of viral defense system